MKIEILSNVNVLITQILLNNSKIDMDTVAFVKNIPDNTTLQTNINKALNINETSNLTYFHKILLVLKNENGKYNDWIEKINKNINLAENYQNILDTILFKKYFLTFTETLLDDSMQLKLDIQYTHYDDNKFIKIIKSLH